MCSNRGRLGFYANIDIILGQCGVHQVIVGATIISAKSHLKEKEKWYFTVLPQATCKDDILAVKNSHMHLPYKLWPLGEWGLGETECRNLFRPNNTTYVDIIFNRHCAIRHKIIFFILCHHHTVSRLLRGRYFQSSLNNALCTMYMYRELIIRYVMKMYASKESAFFFVNVSFKLR